MVLKKIYISGPARDKGICSSLPSFKKKHIYVLVVLLLICAAVIAGFVWVHFQKPNGLLPPNPTEELPPSFSKLRSFRRAAVCSDSAICSDIGRDILEKNGSVVDASLATMFCNGVLNMQSMGLGGGFLMTIYIHDTKEAITLNAREAAPLLATEAMFQNNSKLTTKGPLAVAVPGELRGYWAAYQRFGKLPWKELIEPTIKICEAGFNISMAMSDAMRYNPTISKDPILSDWFVNPKTKSFKRAGSLVKPLKLCNTLRIVADNGGNDLYNGTISKMLLEDIKEMGGIIKQADFDSYKAKWSQPIKVSLRNNETLYSVKPPGGGAVLGFILNILNGYNFTNESISDLNSTILTYHRLAEAFKFAYAKRTELGDLDFIDGGLRELLNNMTSPEYGSMIRKQINDTATYQEPKHYGAKFFGQADHGTSHLSVIAPNGDAVAATSSVNIYFGASVTSQRTGIILNSGMDDFSYPGFKSYFNLPGSPANAMVPGKRSLSSQTPSIVVDENGDVKVVIGASGGTKITTAIAQVLIRYLWFNQDIKKAVDAPRLHHQVYPMEVTYNYGVLQQILDGLERLGHKTSRFENAGSVVCALVKHLDKIYANADYRKGGDVSGID